MILPCGCTFYTDSCDVLRLKERCDEHNQVEDSMSLTAEYYGNFAVIDSTHRFANHERELRDALGDFPLADGEGKTVLEVGCGVSRYASVILRSGYKYIGTDINEYAVNTTLRMHESDRVQGVCRDYLDLQLQSKVDLILSAHTLEHFADPHEALRKMYNDLVPGGRLIIIVPEGTDLLNRGHLSFFFYEDLTKIIETAGFIVHRVSSKKVVDKEKFIYVLAQKSPIPSVPRRRFIFITGFHRTGTTWLFNQVRRFYETDSINEEQGLNYVWELGGSTTSELKLIKERSASSVLHLHMLKNAKAGRVELLDRLTATASSNWVFKTPTLHVDSDFVPDYVSQSSKWNCGEVLCCYRPSEDSWRSALKKWPFWSETIGRDEYTRLHEQYYSQAKEAGWRVLSHSDMHANSQNVLDTLASEFDFEQILVSPFEVNS